MIRRILDTSIAAAWYLPEATTPAARRWQRQMLDGAAEFWVPSLHYWELGNVLRTHVRRGELDAHLARDLYEVHLEAPLLIVEPDRSSILELALKYEATVYDAVYISLALEHQIPLLTAERSTATWVRKLDRLADCIP